MPDASDSTVAALLTPEEEHDLALAMEAGVLAQEALDSGSTAGDPAASPAELRQLVREGEAARLRFIEANVGLAGMVARQVAARGGSAEADLFQEACLGLLLAVLRFDCRRGFRFATYALFWIRARASAASAGLLELSLPTSRASQLRAVRGIESELTQRLGRMPTAQDLATETGRPRRWVAGLLAHRPPLSLSGLETELANSVAPTAPTAELSARQLLDRLGRVSRQVLELRMGFATGEPLGYAAVSRRLRIPVSRIRRLEEKALDELRGICPYDAAQGWW